MWCRGVVCACVKHSLVDEPKERIQVTSKNMFALQQVSYFLDQFQCSSVCSISKNASLSNHLPTWGNSEYSSTLRLFRSLKFSVQKESANHAKTLKDVHVRVNCIQTFVISHSYHTHIYLYISNYNIRLTIIYMSK